MIAILILSAGAVFVLSVLYLAISAALDARKPKAPTVLVCGATGVGKSTLINAIAGRNVADAGIGAPVTQNTVYIGVPELNLAFYDSKGLEVEEASQTYLLLLGDLLSLRYNRFHFKQIDLVLICIQETQARIDDAHEEIAALCADMKIPYAVALTKAEDNFSFREKVAETFTSAAFIQPVHSLPIKLGSKVIEPEGLEELVAAFRANQNWNSNAGRARRKMAASTERLALAARNLASTQTDSAWREFASTAHEILLRPRNKKDMPYWAILNGLRDKVRKELVPGFFDRVLMTKFDNGKIDAALAKRLVPRIVQAFTNKQRSLENIFDKAVIKEATGLLKSDRPYRSRF